MARSSKQTLFEKYYNQRLGRQLIWRVYRKTKRLLRSYPRYYRGKKVKSGKEGSDYVKALLVEPNGKPFFVSRIGSVEGELVQQYLRIEFGLSHSYPDWLRTQASTNAGVFPTDDAHLSVFSRIFLKESREIDCLAIWDMAAEHYILDTTQKPICPIDFYCLYPGLNDWTKGLAGRRVLVIHPFVETMKSQYLGPNRYGIFQDKSLLPDFELLTIKSVVSLADEKSDFTSWEAALEWMYKEAAKIKDCFDVCLLGCGAYGLPLGARIYRTLGKQVIHVGGSLQLLFGIKGAVWESYPPTRKLINEFWVYPSKDETPQNAFKVENSCYWAPSEKLR